MQGKILGPFSSCGSPFQFSSSAKEITGFGPSQTLIIWPRRVGEQFYGETKVVVLIEAGLAPPMKKMRFLVESGK